MKRFAVKLIGAAVLGSSVLTAAAPAQARHRHHHRDRVDGGDILAGIVLIGAIAAIAGSGKKERARDREWREEDARNPPYPDQDYRAAPDTNQGGRWVPGSNSAETRAVDACSWAAEGELGNQARVGQIDAVTSDGDGWRVTGNVAAPETMPRDFACNYRSGRVTEVSLR